MGLREDINQIKLAQPKFSVNFVIASVRFAKGNQAPDSDNANEFVNLDSSLAEWFQGRGGREIVVEFECEHLYQ